MDVSSIATAYATFGGVLAGFAFAGLSFYVTRSPEPEPGAHNVDVLITGKGEPLLIDLIPVSSVAAAGFYAMASLAISTFLYANLAGLSGRGRAGEAAIALLFYGVVLALSVLALFYFVTLMLFERPLTKAAAQPAFWAGTFAGSLVVLRFLAGSALDARIVRCPGGYHPPPCHLGWGYTAYGIVCVLVVAALIFLGTTLRRVLERRWLRRLLKPFAQHPTVPSIGVFVTAAAIATFASFYVNTRHRSYVPSGWLILWSYVLGIALIVLFAFASGSVIYPRVHSVRLTEPSAWAQTRGSNKIPWFGRVDIATLRYFTGSRPTRRGRQLIWKVPPRAVQGTAAASELTTSFDVRHDLGHEKRQWLLGGRMFLAREPKVPAGDHKVHVTLTAEPGQDGWRFERDISAHSEVELDNAEPTTDDVVHLTIQRIDSSPDDVVFCWFGAGGTLLAPEPETQAQPDD